MSLISIKVKTGSSKPGVESSGDNSYNVWLRKRPKDNEANLELIEILSDYFDVPKSSVNILKGLRSRNKLVNIEDGNKE